MATVLVTGGSGYIASFCIIELLRQGHDVRTTVRTLARESKVREMIANGGVEAKDRLKVFAAELQSDAGWELAIDGCDYVLHVASPTLNQLPKNDEEMVKPAREGVLRIHRFARDLGVKRVVLTSAIGAIAYGHPAVNRPFTEEDWTDVSAGVAPYQKSKTLAERAAWEFIKKEGKGLELVAINPVAVLGPVLGNDFSPSLGLIVRMLKGELKFCPKFSCGFVDVRDVADLHIRAMTHPAAAGKRFIATAGRSRSVLELAQILRRTMGDRAVKAPTKEIPSWILRIVALKNAGVRFFVPQLGKNLDATSAKAIRELQWSARDIEETVSATAESLFSHKIV